MTKCPARAPRGACSPPSIQEEVLALECPRGREPITERTSRRLLESLVWEDQRATWSELRPAAG